MSAGTAEIRLPPDLIPADGRFGSGPSKVRTESLAALAATGSRYLGTSHRQEPVKAVVRGIREGLAALLSLADGYEVVLGIGGATLFWDAAVFSLVERRSQHLVFGEFSSKFAAVAAGAPHLDDPEIVESAPGTHPEAHPSDGVDLYALTHNETSTGVMMPIVRPAGASGLVAVDATSAAGALPVDAAQFDVYYLSPQKVFASEGGLWVAVCSPAAVERVERIAASGRWVPPSLDLRLAIANSRQNQTYNTPALATLFLFRDQVDWINGQGGLAWSAARCAASAAAVYGWAEGAPFARPFVDRPEQRSHTVATIDFEGVDAMDVAAVLRRHGVVDIESYRKLGRNQLRIGMFPAVEPDDLVTLTGAIDYVVERLA